MPVTFRYATPEWVHSGAGSLARLPGALDQLRATRVLVMTTTSLTDQVGRIEAQLGDREHTTFGGCGQHSPEASVAAALAVAGGADVLVSFGGGSVIDTAKAVAAGLRDAAGGVAPAHVAIPTTLSAGEFTAAAGITNEASRFKHLLIRRDLQPRVVIHDPELTAWTPAQLWQSTGIKALDHALEGLWSARPHPVTDLTALDAAGRLLRWLPESAPSDSIEARNNCQIAAWLSIVGMTNSGTRLSHPIGHQIGAWWNVPHGITSCITLPVVMRAMDGLTGAVRDKVAPLFGVSTAAAAADQLTEMLERMGLPHRLRDTNARRDEIPTVAAAVVSEFRQMGREPEADVEALLQAMW